MLIRQKRTILILFVFLILTCVSACSSFRLSNLPEIEPWVAPYEREYLADPIMSFNKDPLSICLMYCL